MRAGASAILTMQRLGERIDALLVWLDTQPYGCAWPSSVRPP
jgi:hypothetical protein